MTHLLILTATLLLTSSVISITNLLLYERAAMNFHDEGMIDIFLGVNSNLISAKTVSVLPDFTSSHLLVSENDIDCSQEISCAKGKDSKSDAIDGKKYTYFDAKTFVGAVRIIPSQMSEENVDKLSQFPFRLTKDLNVLGLGPNSEVWQAWDSTYYLHLGILNITYCNYPAHPHLRFLSAIQEGELFLSVPKTQTRYSFDSLVKLGDINQLVTTCVIANRNDLFFEVSLPLYQSLFKTLCKNPAQCTTKDDLKDLSKQSIELTISKSNKIQKLQIPLSDLVTIDNDKLIFSFGTKEIQNCAFALQSKFFTKYYFIISNDIKKSEVMFGFREIKKSDFFLLDLWKYLLLVLGALLIISGGLYVYRKSSAKQAENYRKISEMSK